MSNIATAFSLHGRFHFDSETGVVFNASELDTKSFGGMPLRVDVVEFKLFYPDGDIVDDVDVLDIGYWVMLRGAEEPTYVPPNAEWREKHVEAKCILVFQHEDGSSYYPFKSRSRKIQKCIGTCFEKDLIDVDKNSEQVFASLVHALGVTEYDNDDPTHWLSIVKVDDFQKVEI